MPSPMLSPAPVSSTQTSRLAGGSEVEPLRGREGGGDARGVVVGAGDDLGEGDVEEQEDGDDQYHRGEELEDAEPVALDAGHARAEDRQQRDEAAPEDDPPRAEQQAAALAEAAGEVDGTLSEDESGPAGVVVGDQHQAQRAPRAGCRGRRRSARRGGRGGSARGRSACSGRGRRRSRPPAPGRSPRRARTSPGRFRRSRWSRSGRGPGRTGCARRWAGSRRFGRAPSGGPRACWRPDARRRCRARAPRSSTAP